MEYKNYYSNPKYLESENTYYGTIYDFPESASIEAENLEEYERIFHQYVDDYLSKKASSDAIKSRKRVIVLLCIAAVIGVAILSCPDRQDHRDAIIAMVNEVVAEKSTLDEEDAGWALLGQSLVKEASEWILEGGLTVKNHFVFSTGKFNTDSGEKLISFGIFGHVFTFGRKALGENLDELF